MSHTQNTIEGAIDRSLTHHEIVTVQLGPEEDMQAVFDALVSDESIEDCDYVDFSPTLREVWGQDTDGDEWRVHLQQDERTGRARYSEEG